MCACVRVSCEYMLTDHAHVWGGHRCRCEDYVWMEGFVCVNPLCVCVHKVMRTSVDAVYMCTDMPVTLAGLLEMGFSLTSQLVPGS